MRASKKKAKAAKFVLEFTTSQLFESIASTITKPAIERSRTKSRSVTRFTIAGTAKQVRKHEPVQLFLTIKGAFVMCSGIPLPTRKREQSSVNALQL